MNVPSVLLQAHSSSLGSAFYTGTQFPAEYRGSLFVATHGSWNRANPTGSKVIRIMFDAAGNPLPYYEDFLTGFVVANHDVWGRPVGITMGADGSLYVSEDDVDRAMTVIAEVLERGEFVDPGAGVVT